MLARQQTPDPRLRQNCIQKLRCDLAIQKSVAVFRKTSSGPTPDHQRRARQTSGTANRTPAAPSAAAPSVPSRTPATASLAAASQALSMADRDRNRAPQNRATAPTKPRWLAIGSPEADDRREPAFSRSTYEKSAPARSSYPRIIPPRRYPRSGNHGKARNATGFSTPC